MRTCLIDYFSRHSDADVSSLSPVVLARKTEQHSSPQPPPKLSPTVQRMTLLEPHIQNSSHNESENNDESDNDIDSRAANNSISTKEDASGLENDREGPAKSRSPPTLSDSAAASPPPQTYNSQTSNGTTTSTNNDMNGSAQKQGQTADPPLTRLQVALAQKDQALRRIEAALGSYRVV